MKKLNLLIANMVFACVALFPPASLADNDLEVTMDVIDNLSQVEGVILEMSAVKGNDEGGDDRGGDHEGDGDRADGHDDRGDDYGGDGYHDDGEEGRGDDHDGDGGDESGRSGVSTLASTLVNIKG